MRCKRETGIDGSHFVQLPRGIMKPVRRLRAACFWKYSPDLQLMGRV